MPSRPSRHACAIAGALALITTLAAAAPRGARRRVLGRHLPGRLAGLHDAPVRGLRDARDGDPARVQPGRPRGTARTDHRRTWCAAGACRAARGRSSTLNAPAGTRFTTFRWAGTLRRRDCRYALQMYADAPDVEPIRDQERARQPRLPAALARTGGPVQRSAAHLQRHPAPHGSCSA